MYVKRKHAVSASQSGFFDVASAKYRVAAIGAWKSATPL
jgi:hypothetical protein